LHLIIVHYAHRLPADYDLAALRRWLKERGTAWDGVPDLYFKAFLLREAGRFGAIANGLASLYLWQQDKPFRDWLVRAATRSSRMSSDERRSKHFWRSTPSGARAVKLVSSTRTISPFRLMTTSQPPLLTKSN
jgi:Domain of unknown function (DUF4865)